MIKMVVTDIDGTILGKSLKLSPKIVSCFKNLKSRGIKTILATGRMYCATLPLAEELGIEDPLVTYQGGFIKSPDVNSKPLKEILLDRKLTLEIADYIRERGIHTNLYADDTLFVENKNELIEKYCSDRNITYKVIANFSGLEFAGAHKLLAIDNDADKISELIEKLSLLYKGKAYITHSTPYFCEVSAPDATKGAAVDFLADLWNLKREEIFAIGDQDNDFELLERAGVKVAMGNSSEGLKKKADFITDSVEDDGFAKAVEKFVLKG